VGEEEPADGGGEGILAGKAGAPVNRIKSEEIYYIHPEGFSDPINLTM
jgi:hypothetical protein